VKERVERFNEIRRKYKPDTPALAKIFINNAPVMIKNLNDVIVPDSILNEYVLQQIENRQELKNRIDRQADEFLYFLKGEGRRWVQSDSMLNLQISSINERRIPDMAPNRLRDSITDDIKHHINKFIGEKRNFADNIQKLYDEFLDGDFVGMRSMINIILDYNKFVSGSTVMRDSLATYLLVSFLPLNVSLAMDVLYYATEYKNLYDNSSKIIKLIDFYCLSRRNDEEELFKEFDRRAISWTNRPDSIGGALKVLLSDRQERLKLAKDTSFVRKYVGNRLYLQALLGDTIAENRLISYYKNDMTFLGRRELLRQLVFVNSPKTIKAVVESFNDEIYDSPCSASIRVPIINELSRIFSEKKILKRLTEVEPFLPLGSTYPFRTPVFFSPQTGVEPRWTAEYVKSVLNWIKKEFNVVPAGNNKTFRLQKSDRGCTIGI